jgi:hypothetical protein
MIRSLAVAAALLLGVTAAVSARDRHPQHDLTATSHHRTVQATLGTHCTMSEGKMTCADFGYPLETEKRLPVHGRGRIRLEFGAEPEELYPELRDHRSRSILELDPRGNGREWTVRLPRHLPQGMDRLGVFVMYRRGDADFEVDLRRHRHR